LTEYCLPPDAFGGVEVRSSNVGYTPVLSPGALMPPWNGVALNLFMVWSGIGTRLLSLNLPFGPSPCALDRFHGCICSGRQSPVIAACIRDWVEPAAVWSVS
jgi:hypothetical protein